MLFASHYFFSGAMATTIRANSAYPVAVDGAFAPPLMLTG